MLSNITFLKNKIDLTLSCKIWPQYYWPASSRPQVSSNPCLSALLWTHEGLFYSAKAQKLLSCTEKLYLAQRIYDFNIWQRQKGEKFWKYMMKKWWHSRSWEIKHHPQHTDFPVTAGCSTSEWELRWRHDVRLGKHRGLAEQLTWQVAKTCWGYLSCCGTKFGKAVHCSRAQFLWKDQSMGCKTESPGYGMKKANCLLQMLCLYTSLLSMPSLQCQLNRRKEVYFKIRPGIKRSIICKGVQEICYLSSA